jgi:DNA-binding response OmpR family regulator
MPEPRVLVVEDDTGLLELITRILEVEGYRVDGVSSGHAAMAAVEAAEPDVLVLDLMLPDADGILLHGRLRRLRPALGRRTIFMTGFSSQAPVLDYLKSLSAVFLHKPFAAAELVSAVDQVARKAGASTIAAGSSRA